MAFFVSLSPEQEKSFRQWARDNYKKHSPINGTWHPVTQDECVKMNAECSPDQAIPSKSKEDFHMKSNRYPNVK